MTVVLVFLGGAVGSSARYLGDRAVQARHSVRFPFGTLTVNLIGCLVLGYVLGRVHSGDWTSNTAALLGTGFCGGLTTFSTFSVEAVELATQRLRMRSMLYVTTSVAGGIALARLGWALA